MPYEVILSHEAERFLNKLDNSIIDRIENLKEKPRGGKPLVGNLRGFWSLRIGEYRVVYQIIDVQLRIVVIQIGHRKNVYE